MKRESSFGVGEANHFDIISTKTIIGVISQTEVIAGNLATAYTSNVNAYDGVYEITPTVDEQELKTKHKYMNDDITIHAIPFFEVSNTSGGNTVFIADKLEIE